MVCSKGGARLCLLPTLAGLTAWFIVLLTLGAAAIALRAAVFGVSGKGRARGVAVVACNDIAGMAGFVGCNRLTGDCDAVVVVEDATEVAFLVRELTGPAFLKDSLVMKG